MEEERCDREGKRYAERERVKGESRWKREGGWRREAGDGRIWRKKVNDGREKRRRPRKRIVEEKRRDGQWKKDDIFPLFSLTFPHLCLISFISSSSSFSQSLLFLFSVTNTGEKRQQQQK